MRRFWIKVFFVILFVPFSVLCSEAHAAGPHPVAQIPLFAVPETGLPEDLAFVVNRYWGKYYNQSGPKAFGPEHLRYGFVDLNDDGTQELILLIEHPAWGTVDGYVMLLGTWSKNLSRWLTIGWSWGDAETIFSTDQVTSGWRSLDTGSQYLAWNGKIYASSKKTGQRQK